MLTIRAMIGAVFLSCFLVSPSLANPTIRVSVGPAGQQANGDSQASDISANGRWVAFSSLATNLARLRHEPVEDVYLRDLRLGRTVLVSVGTRGQRGNGRSSDAALSSDGRFVCFSSFASNLVPGDTNGETDIFLRDRRLGKTMRVNVNSQGQEGHDTTFDCDISADGRVIVFDSGADNLVPGDTNRDFDIFLYDRLAGIVARVSLGPSGAQAQGGYCIHPSLSDEGRFLAFQSSARNLVRGAIGPGANVYVRDLKTGRNTLASRGLNGRPIDLGAGSPMISGDGRFVAFDSNSSNLVPNDTNGFDDVFVFDRQTERTERVSVTSGGAQANEASLTPEISADGRFVLFMSYADNLVPNDTNDAADVFVHDRATGTTERVSVGSRQQQADGRSEFHFAIEPGGRFAIFTSAADNLVPDDTNGVRDVFLHEGRPPTKQPGSAVPRAPQ